MEIKKKCFIIFTLSFVLFTIIGTISHELGHIFTAKLLGFKTTKLHYGSMEYSDLPLRNEVLKMYKKNKNSVDNKSTYKDKDIFLRKSKKLKNKQLFVTFGGPLQTILTGTLGLLILLIRNPKRKREFKIIDWLAVFLSLFWLREVFNLTMAFIQSIIYSKSIFFSGDEYYLSKELHLWEGTISILFGILGLFISVFVVYKIIPKNIRLTFILSGFFGGVLGFILWFYYIGPILIP